MIKKIFSFSIDKRSRFHLFVFLIVSLPFINSCYITSSSRSAITYDVKIISDPPGARIEINGNYVGDAPLEVKIEGTSDRYFKNDTEMVAYPIYEGQLIERKSFDKYLNLYGISGDKIPERILFVMMTRGTNKYDIKIQKK